VILLFPVVAIIWFLGWGLYRVGSKKEPAKSKEITEQEDLTFTVPTPQENYATQH
jgi:hypothetical protein